MLGTNALAYACQVLRNGFEKNQENLNYSSDGTVEEAKRFVVKIGCSQPKEVIMCGRTETDEVDSCQDGL